MRRVYLAGPEVFLPDAAAIGERKKTLCERHGLTGLWPGDAVAGLEDDPAAMFDALVVMLDAADALIANVTPWRGINADAGTAFEMGYLYARGVPVHAYTHEPRDFADRVPDDAALVEGGGLADNLMLEGPRLVADARIVRATVAEPDRWTALDAFEECVRLVAADLSRGSS